MKFFVTCAKGTEGALRRELVALRIHAPRGDTGGVSFEGPFADGMKVCLWSRVGMRVMLELAAFQAPDAEALYAGTRAIDWAPFLTLRSTFAVSASVTDSQTLRHSGFAALKVKDAIADALRDQLGSRPDVDAKDPDVAVALHVRGTDARVYLDLAREPLHRRGYRVAMTAAPLKETLAAAVLSLGRVDPELPFVDPMAGSGTFAIEQALAARKIAPGLHRSFGFERWPDPALRSGFEALRREANDTALPAAPAPIVARDIDPDAISAARANAKKAHVAPSINFEVGGVSALAVRGAAGTLCTNPPYGERMAPASLDLVYDDLAQAIEKAKGWSTVLLAATPQVANAVGRRPDISHKLWNGPIEIRLLCWS